MSFESIVLQIGGEAGLFFLFLLLWLVVAVFVGNHAKENGRSGLLWGVFVFFTGLIGIGIYVIVLAVDEAGGPKRICPDCGLENDESASYCSDCGHQFKADT